MNDFIKISSPPEEVHAELDKALEVTHLFRDQLAQTPVSILRSFSADMVVDNNEESFDDFLSFLIEQGSHFHGEVPKLIPCGETSVNPQANGFKTSTELDKNMLNTLKTLFQVRTKIQQVEKKEDIEVIKKVSAIVAAIGTIHRDLQRVFDQAAVAPVQSLILEPESEPEPERAICKTKMTTMEIEWLFGEGIISDPQSLYLTCLALSEQPLSAREIAMKLGIKGPNMGNGNRFGSTHVVKNIGAAIQKANKALKEKGIQYEICSDYQKRLTIYQIRLGE